MGFHAMDVQAACDAGAAEVVKSAASGLAAGAVVGVGSGVGTAVGVEAGLFGALDTTAAA
jgi:hypothetical protein